MKRQVLFIQGGGEGVHDNWDNHLVDSLNASLGSAYELHYPRMPTEDDPKYDPWKAAIEKAIGALTDGAVLVGHSIGGTVLINTLASHPAVRALGGIVLLSAPFVGEGGWPSREMEPRPRLGADLPEGVPVHLYHGSADEEVPPAHLNLYRKAIPQAVTRVLEGRDHQLGNDLTAVAEDIQALG